MARLAKDHWRRDKHSFKNFLALERAPLDGPDTLGRLTGALVSADTRSGAQTFLVEIPKGFRRKHDEKLASLEFFTLRGDLSLNGVAVGASGYIHLPQAGGGGEIRSKNGALALAFWNPNLPSFPPPYTQNTCLRLWEEEWLPSLPGSHSVMHKSLRRPDPYGGDFDGGPGGFLRVMFIGPGVDAPYEHVHHECFEEIFQLAGDVLLGDEGIMGLGSVTLHPQEWWHGPFASRTGAIVLVHTDAPMGLPWPPREDDYPIAKQMCCAYMDEEPWDVHAEHTPFAETAYTRLQKNAAFQKWAKSAPEFGDKVGRDVASSFRAAWNFDQQKKKG